MLRAFLSGLLCLTLSLSVAVGDDKKGDEKNKKEAKITKIDGKNHTVTLKMKDKDGKDVEKDFKLAETVRYFDSTGKVVAIDVFKSGDYVLVLEADGQVKELHQKKKTTGDKKP